MATALNLKSIPFPIHKIEPSSMCTSLSFQSLLLPHHAIQIIQPPLRLSDQLLPLRPESLVPFRLHPVQLHQYLSQDRLTQLLILEIPTLLILRRILHEILRLR